MLLIQHESDGPSNLVSRSEGLSMEEWQRQYSRRTKRCPRRLVLESQTPRCGLSRCPASTPRRTHPLPTPNPPGREPRTPERLRRKFIDHQPHAVPAASFVARGVEETTGEVLRGCRLSEAVAAVASRVTDRSRAAVRSREGAESVSGDRWAPAMAAETPPSPSLCSLRVPDPRLTSQAV